MKKILMGTSAVALAGVTAGEANAAEWDLKWGGYFEAALVFADTDGGVAGSDHDGVDVVTDREIFFNPSITLDNGLTFGVNIQLEGETNSDQIDESYAYVSGSFGRVVIGDENSAGYIMAYGAPDVTWIGVNSGSLTGILNIGGTFTPTSFTEVVGLNGAGGLTGRNDAAGITYFTPRFAGFQLGVSYARDGVQDGGEFANLNGGNIHENIFDIGANYVNSFGAFDVAISGRYGKSEFNGNDPSTWAAGINVGYAGVKVGGSYSNQDTDAGPEADFFDVGISYETGPWGFSLTYGLLDEDNTAVDELQQIIGGASYALGPGVTAGVFAGWVDRDNVGGGSVDGFAIGTGFKLSF